MRQPLVVGSSVVLLGLLTGLASPIQAQAEEETRLRNGSFEQARGDRPAGWRSNTWGGEASFSYASTGRTGTHSVLISSTAGADAAWSQTIAIEPFTRYRLSAWNKTQDLNDTNGRGAQLNIHEK